MLTAHSDIATCPTRSHKNMVSSLSHKPLAAKCLDSWFVWAADNHILHDNARTVQYHPIQTLANKLMR